MTTKNFFALRDVEVIEDGKETETHFIRVAEVKDGERVLVVDFLKSKKAAVWGDFLPAKVADSKGNVLWNFKDENFKGIAKIFRLERKHQNKDEAIDLIALIRNDSIEKVIPLCDLGRVEFVEVGGEKIQLGGHDISEIARIKIRLACQENMKWQLTEREKEVNKTISKAEENQASLERLKKEEARQARRQEILSRDNIIAFKDGQRLFGTPVQAGSDEWMVLPDGHAAIECDYAIEEKIATNPVAAFFVKKTTSGKAKRLSEKSGLTFDDPNKKPEKSLKGSGVHIFNINGAFKPLLILDEEMAKEVVTTVNSGTMVAIPISEDEYRIVALEKGCIKEVCIAKPM